MSAKGKGRSDPQAGPELRRQAEENARTDEATTEESLSPEETRRVLHELRVHQIELELQNEELRRAQEALELSRTRYFDLYDLAPVGYFTLSEEGLILEANLTAATLFGAVKSALVKQPLTRFIVHEDQDIYYRHRKQLFETGAPQAFELRMLRPNAPPFWARLETTTAQNGGSGAPGCRGVVSDITERKRAEEELRGKKKELEHLLYAISHDLKSPLVTIKTFLGYLEQDLARSDAGRVEKDWSYLRAASNKAERSLNEFLELSRIGRIQNSPVRVSFLELVDEVLSAVAGPIAKRGVEVNIGRKSVLLVGDRPLLEKIWQNLVENTVKFMGDQAAPRLELGVERRASETVFFVRDNGMGIDPRFQSRVFGLFQKADPKSEGMGLGLALVERIVKLYEGTIQLESEGLGRGACFRFTLPAAVENSREGEPS